jgi:predicted DNA-binding protein
MNKTTVEKFSSLPTLTKKRTLKRISINLASDEAQNLDKYCKQTGKTATDVIRELIAALP